MDDGEKTLEETISFPQITVELSRNGWANLTKKIARA